MKKLTLILLILISWSSSALAETYSSPFGFSINIPSHWLILSAQELKNNPDLFDFNNPIFKNTDRSMLEQMKNMITSGKIEMYFNQKTSDSSFNDNINVFKQIGAIPQTVSESKQICNSLPGYLSKTFGKSLKVYGCGLTKISDVNASYTEFDGVADGTRTISYQIQRSQNITITITATCKNKSLGIFRKEFKDILDSIKFQ
jgi:hypothetical protein